MVISLRTFASNTINSIRRAGNDSATNSSSKLKNTLSKSQTINQTRADNFLDTTSVSVSDKIKNQTKIKISDSVSLLNKKTDLTEKQLNDVQTLLEKAKKIKDETDSSKVRAQQEEAATLLETSNTNYQQSTSSDERLAEASAISISIPSSNSSADNFLRTTITATSSLNNYGVSSNLSFSKENINSTISTLESARSSIQNQLSSYDSIRSIFSSTLSETVSQSGLNEAEQNKNYQNLADKIVNQISSSRDEALKSNKVSEIDVQSLIS